MERRSSRCASAAAARASAAASFTLSNSTSPDWSTTETVGVSAGVVRDIIPAAINPDIGIDQPPPATRTAPGISPALSLRWIVVRDAVQRSTASASEIVGPSVEDGSDITTV